MINDHILLKKVRYLTFLYNKTDLSCQSRMPDSMDVVLHIIIYKALFDSAEEMVKISTIKLLGKKIETGSYSLE